MKKMKYTALTLGPIYKTINRVKRTRATWAASYFFSYLTKKIMEKCKEKGLTTILPYDGKIFQSRHGAGLYADRIYFEGNVMVKLEEFIDEILKEIADDIENITNNGNALEYLKNYLNIHIIESNLENDKNILLELNRHLDQAELQQNFPLHDDPSPLLDYLDAQLSHNSIIVQDAFSGNTNKHKRFLSIPEIATSELKEKCPEAYNEVVSKMENCHRKEPVGHLGEHPKCDEDIDFIDELEQKDECKLHIRPYHKYFAVLYADGDNIGKLLERIGNDSCKLKDFSRALLTFGQQAEEIIREFGGSGIYLGGEDILAYLPIASVKEGELQTVFDLLRKLDKAFDDTLGELAMDQQVTTPTLSYGIMMAYAKHPIREVRKIALSLLHDKAKKTPCKNSIALRFQKHSGQYTECVIEKGKTCSFTALHEMIHAYKSKDKEILTGLIHRLKDDLFFTTFIQAARMNRLEDFMENSFNEPIHKDKQSFIQHFTDLSRKVANDYPDNRQVRDILFTVLRYIQFINSKN